MGVRVLNRRQFHYDDNPIANPSQDAIAGPGKYTVKVLHQHFGPDYFAEIRTPDGRYVDSHGMSSPDYVKSWVEKYVYQGQHGTYDVLPRLQWKPGKVWGEYVVTFTVRGRNPSAVGEVGKSLSGEQKRLVLESMRDVYKENRLDKEEKGIDYRGEMIWGYPYSPDLFKTSSITGRPIRYYITLPDGRFAHPTEVYPTIRQSEVDREIQAREYAEKEEQQRIADKLKRVVEPTHSDPMQEANIRYYKTNRKREGSYFAYDSKGRIVRVDGNDSKDVRFWEDRGFFKR